ncbi:hypothetical protein ACJD0Z_00270 [Flavobacteriaceae bacterium M23B6Z8]
MIKRLAIVAFITGVGHLMNLFSLKFITKYIDEDAIASIGEIDALILLIVSITAFGLQLSSARNIVIQDNWKQELYESQAARFTLGLILTIFGFSGLLFTKNYMFLIAPFISLNADYALYSRGKPISGALIAFIRIMIPSVILITASIYLKKHVTLLFSLSIFVSYIMIGILVSWILKTPYLVVPRFKSLKKYIDNFTIGIASFALFFVGIGIINVMSYFYTNEAIAVIYIALKLYMIFKGVIRIITQSFFKELQAAEMAIKVDFLAIVAGLVFLLSIVIYPQVVISLLFEKKYIYYTATFAILGIAGFISSFTTSSSTRLLLKRQDKSYSINMVIAALITIITGIILWFIYGSKPYLMAIAVLMGEITISFLNVKSLNESNYILLRAKQALTPVLLGIIFLVFKYYFGETWQSFIASVLIFGGFLVAYFIKFLNPRVK